MNRLNVLQERVLVQLVSGAKTIEELKAVTNASYSDLIWSVRQMVLDNMVDKKKGFPTKYRLGEKSLLLAKKLRAKLDMSDLLTDPCQVLSPNGFEVAKSVSATKR